MKIKLVSSEPLIRNSTPEIWTPKFQNTKILGLNRRRFLTLSCAAAIGFTTPLATNILYSEKVDAQFYQWINLIPIALAGMQIIEKFIQYGQQLVTRIQADNDNPVPQQGNIGTAVVKLVSSEPLHQDVYFVDTIPPYTRNTYEIYYPSGPVGRNLAIAQSQVNRVQGQFTVG